MGLAALASAQQTPAGPTKPVDASMHGKAADATEPAPTAAIALPEAAVQAEVTAAALRDIEASPGADDTAREIAVELPVLTREIDVRLGEHAKIMAQRPSLEVLRTLERGWKRTHDRLAALTQEMTQRVAELDHTIARLSDFEKTWSETRAAARSEAPREIVQRIETLLNEIKRARSAVETRRSDALRLQNRVTAQDSRASQALAAIKARRDETIDRVLEKDSPPIWNAALIARASASIARDMKQSLQSQLDTLEIYGARATGHFVLHFAIFVLLAFVLWRLRRQLHASAQGGPDMRRAALIFTMPVATALVIAAYASRWIYPEAPRLLWAAVGVAALVPTAMILRRMIDRGLLPVLYAIIIFYVIDQVRAVVASLEAVPRLLFVGEMICGVLFLLWFLQSLRAPVASVDSTLHGNHSTLRGKMIRIAAWAALAFCVATGIANALGYVTLSNLLGNAVMSSAYYGLVLFALTVIIEGLIAFALSVRPLMLLGMVQRHGDLLLRRLRLIVRAGALVLWGVFLLDRLAIRERVVDAGKTALTSELTLGSIGISLGDVVAFGVTVWASFVVSAFVQFMLEEDVYPRAKLGRGLPYAISRTLHYTILLTGFLLGVAALGFDMTKFTILAGAFTVGVGFGLQNIFNNFVSGLILLFERPVQVGDVIQMDDIAGTVDRIGIRASVVRANNGSEIIVPNGKLISERLVNWTFSNRQRGIELDVAVAHGADPKRVIELMNAAAVAHPQVRKSPPPQTLLTRMGPEWLGFELRAWTERIEDWVQIRSDLSIAISDALAAENIALK